MLRVPVTVDKDQGLIMGELCGVYSEYLDDIWQHGNVTMLQHEKKSKQTNYLMSVAAGSTVY